MDERLGELADLRRGAGEQLPVLMPGHPAAIAP